MIVGNGRAFIRIGARHDQVIGTPKKKQLVRAALLSPTRLYAMCLLNPMFSRGFVVFAVLLGIVAGAGIVPGQLVAAESPAVNKVEAKVQSGGGRGKFVSFKDGTLTIEANDGTLIRNTLPESTKTFQWNDDGGFKPVETAATLEQVKARAWIHIQLERGTANIRIGSRKGVTIGTFVSYKDNRLLLLSKNLGESFVKKYGNQVHFNKFRDDVQAFESVDGGDYQLLGLANKVLGDIKEGTVITVHGEGDDNITLVQIGVPTKK